MRAGEDLRVEKPGVRLVGLPGFSVDLGEIIKWNLENIYIFKKKRRNHSDLTRRIRSEEHTSELQSHAY